MNEKETFLSSLGSLLPAAEELSAAGYGLMAARDDLFLEMEGSPKILTALKRCLNIMRLSSSQTGA